MSIWRRSALSPVPEEVNSREPSSNEFNSLLTNAADQTTRQNQTPSSKLGYGSMEQQQTENSGNRTHNSGKNLIQTCCCRSLQLLVIAAAVVLAVRFAFNGWVSDTSFNPKSASASFLPKALANISSKSIHRMTFGNLASSLVPAVYMDMLPRCSVFTKDVMPGEVYTARKAILMTRNMLDVFSPVYPNATKFHSKLRDPWNDLRNVLDEGYETIGDFLDLNHSHVKYDLERLTSSREQVLKWYARFLKFQQKHNILQFLKETQSGCFIHPESRFYWKHTSDRPDGKEPATAGLRRLGGHQLDLSLFYFKCAFPYNQINETVHEYYHNLRKTLRSFLDEYEVFGGAFVPKTKMNKKIVSRLNSVRSYLGDLNDDWTAYKIYEADETHPKEKQELGQNISKAWMSFKEWATEVDLEGSLLSLRQKLNSTSSYSFLDEKGKHRSDIPPSKSLLDFLQIRKANPTRNIVIGNEAGDADSIISAITLAYVESMKTNIPKTPIVSIPKASFKQQRPETKLLLSLAGIRSASKDLIFVDDNIIQNSVDDLNVTLVDHNRLADKFSNKSWEIVEIIDHHSDEGLYLDTCSGSLRRIAFEDDRALVASACTLVFERLQELYDPPFPISVALLLLGVILLDSSNLDPAMGKVTQRDVNAVHALLNHTNWQLLPKDSKKQLKMKQSLVPNITVFFQELQHAKYNRHFWKSLTVQDCLRLDYKEYSYTNTSFGVSSVLLPLKVFARKSDFYPEMANFMETQHIPFLAIMLAYETHENICRQLVLAAPKNFQIDMLADYLIRTNDGPDSLQLQVIETCLPGDGGTLIFRCFDQKNVQASRKQIGPLIQKFFENNYLDINE